MVLRVQLLEKGFFRSREARATSSTSLLGVSGGSGAKPRELFGFGGDFLREALIPIGSLGIQMFVRCPVGKNVIFAKGASVSDRSISASVKIENRVRDFCKGYKRLGQSQIRLGNFSEAKSGF